MLMLLWLHHTFTICTAGRGFGKAHSLRVTRLGRMKFSIRCREPQHIINSCSDISCCLL